MAKRRQTRITTIFIDSSVLFTAVRSPTGGSAKLFTLKYLSLTTSKVVLAEVERNVRKKLHSYHLSRFFTLASHLTIYPEAPHQSAIKQAKKVIVDKDAVILAQAKRSKASILVTLDKKHFLTPKVAVFLKPQKVATPKMLLELFNKN